MSIYKQVQIVWLICALISIAYYVITGHGYWQPIGKSQEDLLRGLLLGAFHVLPFLWTFFSWLFSLVD